MRIVILLLSLLVSTSTAWAQNEFLGTSPRGATELAPMQVKPSAPPAGTPAVGPNGAAPAVMTAVPASSPPMVQRPLPPDPAAAVVPVVFGSQMFVGRFASESFAGFNPDYVVAPGDRVAIRIWGAFTFEGTQGVDAQGNVFLPNVGPVRVGGVRNGDLNREVESQTKRVFKANVGVYATLEAAQPVKIYVTGFVKAPGLYTGLSSDSILHYLDTAGGIDTDRGSYLMVDVMRGGKPRARFNLYDFLLHGQIAAIQLQDGDTIVAHPRQQTVLVTGEVMNPYIFEFATSGLTGAELLAMSRPKPGATHVRIVRKFGTERRSEYLPLTSAATALVRDGDEVTVVSDKAVGTILVQMQGSHLGERTMILPYGSRLSDALARFKPAPQSRIESLQLFRKSVAARQKEMLEASLQQMETYALTARSATSEEAALRTREAELLLQFIERARKVVPKGQVILANKAEAPNTLLEDGDILVVPEESNLVLVSGEVVFPNALVHDPKARAADYIAQAGGYTQNADESKLIVLHQDGSVALNGGPLIPGDQIMVLPKIDTKRVEVTRGITQILYQIAVAAKVLFAL